MHAGDPAHHRPGKKLLIAQSVGRIGGVHRAPGGENEIGDAVFRRVGAYVGQRFQRILTQARKAGAGRQLGGKDPGLAANCPVFVHKIRNGAANPIAGGELTESLFASRQQKGLALCNHLVYFCYRFQHSNIP